MAMRDAAQDPAVIVITQAGQLNTGAFDPHEKIIAAARQHKNVWVHVDGAFGLWARACPTRAALAAGVEFADSWATDGHKWLQTPYDCGFAIVRDAEAHRRAMTIAEACHHRGMSSETDRKYIGKRFRECLATLAVRFGYANREMDSGL